MPADPPQPSGQLRRTRRSSVTNFAESLAGNENGPPPEPPPRRVPPVKLQARAAASGAVLPPADPEAPSRIAARLASARAELRRVRARIVPLALGLAALFLLIGGAVGGSLAATAEPAAPLVLCLCIPGVICALLAILPSEPLAARAAALGCALALLLFASVAVWDVAERAAAIRTSAGCGSEGARVPESSRWA